MSLSPDNVLVVYRQGNSDSYEFARYYAAIHNITHLLAVPCSGDEILASYSDFHTQIESHILDYVITEYSLIKCVVLSYGVPAGFNLAGNKVSSTSRISNIFAGISEDPRNHLYNRQTFLAFSDIDAASVLICSCFDAPNLAIAKAQVDRCKSVSRTGYANGKFFFDKVTLNPDTAYLNDLADFENTILPVLNMKTFRTVPDGVNDVPLFRLLDESFVWSWKSELAGYTYFQETKVARIFCFNADGLASSIRDNNSRHWPLLSISSGYACCAGTICDTSPDLFIRPKPFFESLLRGSTIGEAYIFSLPSFNSGMTLYGDPLIKVRFPTGIALNNDITEVSAFQQMADDIASSIAFNVKFRGLMRGIFNAINDSADLETKGDLFASALQNSNTASSGGFGQFSEVAQRFLSFPLSEINSFLSLNNLKVSRYLNATAGSAVVSPSNIYQQGSWYIETDIVRREFGFSSYHFELELSHTSDHVNPFLVLHSSSNATGWVYEKNKDVFEAIPNGGVTANFAGRRIRYVSPSLIDIGTIYYARIRQIDESNTYTAWVESIRIINT
jgi:hypothetical protein